MAPVDPDPNWHTGVIAVDGALVAEDERTEPTAEGALPDELVAQAIHWPVPSRMYVFRYRYARESDGNGPFYGAVLGGALHDETAGSAVEIPSESKHVDVHDVFQTAVAEDVPPIHVENDAKLRTAESVADYTGTRASVMALSGEYRERE